MNRHHYGSILFLFDLDLMLVDPPRLDLFKRRNALYGRFMAVQLRRKIEVCVA